MKLGVLATGAAYGTTLLPSSPQQCCSALLKEAGLSDLVATKNQSLYNERIDSYWSVSAALHPDCMVLPKTPEDVSKVMKVIAKNQCKFGIRGGGHGNFKLSNSVEEGITIDFGFMNGTSYDEEKNVVSVGPGGHWQDVYDTLIPYGLAVAGGRAGTVGVGGFVTGGGNSFYSASHGMACDTVAGWQLVLANGDIVEANAESNADLWQAMKGGSGNLGLITRIDMYPIEFVDRNNPSIWGGNLLYKPESGPAVIDALIDFTANVPKDENSSSIVYWAYLPALAGGTILNAAIENTKGEVKPPAFDSFYAIPDIQGDTTVTEKLSKVTKDLGSGQPPHFRNVWFTSSFKPNAELLNYVVEKYDELNQALEALMPSAESELNTLCMFQPITKSIAEKGVKNGGNVMGLDKYTEDGDGIMFLLTWAAKGEASEEAAFPLLKAYMDDIETKAKEMDAWWAWKFINYAHLTQDPLATIGDEALAKLRAASKKYDPQGVFQKLRSSGVKIPF
ncbi:nicotine oxidase [Fusarium tjaetaba]|uniref:Nicotine oxidase n=1 Tax=Fusarium tjaetaba TaxID=1567544 RepID=A0A8H5QSW8_9HYPO|nr:nicotine oxidase [Fusarium tjaetaba]KAF5620757.1 nicotine oxidase [Fusarium tjaetaba]